MAKGPVFDIVSLHMLKHVAIEVYGRVQNVFFRKAAKHKAERLGIKGFVENRNDGSVYLEAEGEPEALEEFIAWCRQGPDSADVIRVDTEFQDAFKEFEKFEMK